MVTWVIVILIVTVSVTVIVIVSVYVYACLVVLCLVCCVHVRDCAMRCTHPLHPQCALSRNGTPSCPPPLTTVADGTTAREYVFDSQALFTDSGIMSGVSFPSVVPTTSTLRQLAVGGPLTGSPPHFHPPAWNAALVGRKLWVLTPPAHAFFSTGVTAWQWLAASAVDSVQRHDSDATVVLQAAGDLVFVPEFWGHAVVNVDDSLAVAFESFQ